MSVVVGAVVVRDGLVLAARRTHPVDLAGQWEFPGGKVEVGEDPSGALVREFDEELRARISVLEEVVDEGCPWRISETYVLRLFLATIVQEEPSPGADHDAIRWIRPDKLNELDWLPSDRLALPAVQRAVESVCRTAVHPPVWRYGDIQVGGDQRPPEGSS